MSKQLPILIRLRPIENGVDRNGRFSSLRELNSRCIRYKSSARTSLKNRFGLVSFAIFWPYQAFAQHQTSLEVTHRSTFQERCPIHQSILHVRRLEHGWKSDHMTRLEWLVDRWVCWRLQRLTKCLHHLCSTVWKPHWAWSGVPFMNNTKRVHQRQFAILQVSNPYSFLFLTVYSSNVNALTTSMWIKGSVAGYGCLLRCHALQIDSMHWCGYCL